MSFQLARYRFFLHRLILFLIIFGLVPGFSSACSADPRVSLTPVLCILQRPYLACLKVAGVNLRKGPGLDYPVVWTLLFPGWPLKITAEFDIWRRIEDPLGSRGWVRTSAISKARHTQILAKTTLYARAKRGSFSRAIMEKGVIAKVIGKKRGWLYLAVTPRWMSGAIGSKSIRGWVPQSVCWCGDLV